jgi:hypothetical protein
VPAELTPESFSKSEFLGTANVLCYEAVRATTSAPTYYSPAIIGGQRMVDGAILQNNPTLIALAEAALLWPGARVETVVSLGTGTMTLRPNAPTGVMSWVKTVLDLAMEAHVTHKTAATLVGERYHRFDPDGQGDIDLGEARLDVIAKMLDDGRRYIQRHEDRFRNLARALGCGERGHSHRPPHSQTGGPPPIPAATAAQEASWAPHRSSSVVPHGPAATSAPAGAASTSVPIDDGVARRAELVQQPAPPTLPSVAQAPVVAGDHVAQAAQATAWTTFD